MDNQFIRLADLPSTKHIKLGHDSGYFPVAVSPDGRSAVIVYRAGAGHMGIAGRLEAVRSDDLLKWSAPVVIADSDWDDRNPAVGATPSGTLVVAYHVNGCYTGPRDYDDKLGRYHTRLTRSRDGGRTWEKPYPLQPDTFDGLSPYGQMFAPPGGLVMPIYGCADWKQGRQKPVGSYLLFSTDEGLTWKEHFLAAQGWNETAFLPLSDGTILAVPRADADSHLGVCRGRNGELSRWGQVTDLTAGHEHPACLTLLSDGWVLLTHGFRQKPFGARGLLSRDGGRTWLKDKPIIVGDWADNWDCGYPSTIRFSDGRVLTAFYSTAGAGDAWSCAGARCHVLVWRETELLTALAAPPV